MMLPIVCASNNSLYCVLGLGEAGVAAWCCFRSCHSKAGINVDVKEVGGRTNFIS